MADKSPQTIDISPTAPNSVLQAATMVAEAEPSAAAAIKAADAAPAAGTAISSEVQRDAGAAYDTATHVYTTTRQIAGATVKTTIKGIVNTATSPKVVENLPGAIQQTSNVPGVTQGAKALIESGGGDMGANALTRGAAKVLNSPPVQKVLDKALNNAPVKFLEENGEALGPITLIGGSAVHVALAPTAEEAGKRAGSDGVLDGGYLATRSLLQEAMAPTAEDVAEAIAAGKTIGETGFSAGGVAAGIAPAVVGYVGKVAWDADAKFNDALQKHETAINDIRPHIDRSNLKNIVVQMDGEFAKKLVHNDKGEVDFKNAANQRLLDAYVENPANQHRLQGYIAGQKKEIQDYVSTNSNLDSFPETMAQKKAFIEATPNGMTWQKGKWHPSITYMEAAPNGVTWQKGSWHPSLTYSERPEDVENFFRKQEQKAQLDAASSELADIRQPQNLAPATVKKGATLTTPQVNWNMDKRGVKPQEGYGYTVVDGKFVPIHDNEPTAPPDFVRQQYEANKAQNHNMGIQLTEYDKHGGKGDATMWDIRENPFSPPPGTTQRGQTPISVEMVEPPLSTPPKAPQQQAAAPKPSPGHA